MTQKSVALLLVSSKIGPPPLQKLDAPPPPTLENVGPPGALDNYGFPEINHWTPSVK